MEQPEINKIYQGDALETLKSWPDEFVDCVVTSPPYFGLRDYGVEGQIGLEQTPEEYVKKLVEVFREVKRCLKKDGTLWLNLGDSYWGSHSMGNCDAEAMGIQKHLTEVYGKAKARTWPKSVGLKPKDLIGIPWRVAFALQADGWYLRQDIIWAKPNPMPESVTDRCTKSHEYIFLLAKSQKYYFDSEAIKEKRATLENRPDGIVRDRECGYESKQAELRKQRNADVRKTGNKEGYKEAHSTGTRTAGNLSAAYKGVKWDVEGVNKRSVWTVTTKPYAEAHFATFPQDLIVPCIKTTRPDAIVLDPFCGTNTTGLVARSLGRRWLGIELNPAYIKMADRRLVQSLLF